MVLLAGTIVRSEFSEVQSWHGRNSTRFEAPNEESIIYGTPETGVGLQRSLNTDPVAKYKVAKSQPCDDLNLIRQPTGQPLGESTSGFRNNNMISSNTVFPMMIDIDFLRRPRHWVWSGQRVWLRWWRDDVHPSGQSLRPQERLRNLGRWTQRPLSPQRVPGRGCPGFRQSKHQVWGH